MSTITLASQSPRRAELLRQIGVDFEVLHVDVDESVHPGERPEQYVERVSRAKARAGHALLPHHPVLGADTAVILDDRILGKPRDRADGLAMLAALADREHRVLTGICLIGRSEHYRLSESRVRFRPISEPELERYWQSGEPADKAGGYAVQGLGAVFIESLAGSYSGVMGLPLFETAELLRLEGISPL